MPSTPASRWEQLDRQQRIEALGYPENFARVSAHQGQQVTVDFDLDPQRWPWLCLPAHDPILINKHQYFAAVTACWATGVFPPGVHSALTRFTWSLNTAAIGAPHASHARLALEQGDGTMQLRLETLGTDQASHYSSESSGAAFGDRNFHQWRARSKAELRRQCPRIDVKRADPTAAGLPPDGVCWLSPPRSRQGRTVFDAQIDQAEAFFPAHPFHTGSGDHVNASQLADCAMQAAHLTLPELGPLICWRGEERFLRFVELDVPFQLSVETTPPADERLTRLHLRFSQAGRDNAVFTLDVAAA